MRKNIFLLVLLFVAICAHTQVNVYPTNWWVGMKENKLQLMIYSKDKDIAVEKLQFKSSSKDIKIIKLHKPENRHYIFVDLEIAKTAKPQTVKFSFSGVVLNEWASFNYELKARHAGNGTTRAQGVSAKDFIYLLMPDRFSNGDSSNDRVKEYRDVSSNRQNRFSRHSGDFKGIENQFGYLGELGVTAIWMTPVIENNTSLMHEWGNEVAGYHGYWFTDHYQVDKRFGGNEGYEAFCKAAQKNGFKVIQDAVYNHVSKEHWFALDPPMKDWINNWPSFTGPHHREEVLFDPYASAHDRKNMLDGWFTDHLPDLNQRNPFMAKYLVQHAIWTTEKFGIDGWRVDTYKYCDEAFLNEVNNALYREFPNIMVFGEAWVNSVVGNAYFTKNTIQSPFRHNANGVIDFQTCFSMLSAMNLSQGWMEGVNKIYTGLAQDVVYKDPMRNCIFLDNHDMDRVFSVVGEDIQKMKMGINWLLTLRGIPQLYYGTEILMKNTKATTDAMVREDFPGGWKEDAVNKFTATGRTDRENDFFNYISKLANYRKKATAITTGKMVQFVPKDGLYVYFRYDATQTVMVITHTGEKAIRPNWSVYQEQLKGAAAGVDVITGKKISFGDWELQPKDSYVIELEK